MSRSDEWPEYRLSSELHLKRCRINGSTDVLYPNVKTPMTISLAQFSVLATIISHLSCWPQHAELCMQANVNKAVRTTAKPARIEVPQLMKQMRMLSV